MFKHLKSLYMTARICLQILVFIFDIQIAFAQNVSAPPPLSFKIATVIL